MPLKVDWLRYLSCLLMTIRQIWMSPSCATSMNASKTNCLSVDFELKRRKIRKIMLTLACKLFRHLICQRFWILHWSSLWKTMRTTTEDYDRPMKQWAHSILHHLCWLWSATTQLSRMRCIVTLPVIRMVWTRMVNHVIVKDAMTYSLITMVWDFQRKNSQHCW